jgi:hypothetical protein
MITPAKVQAILALKSALPPVPDELRRRVQSIRVRSAKQEGSGQVHWRHKASNHGAHPTSFSSIRANPSSESLNNRWRNSSSGNLSQASNSSPQTPFRFSNTSPAAQPTGPPQFHRSVSQQSLPQTPATPAGQSPPPQTPTMPTRYISKFHNGAKKGDDQILNTVILNKLNVFSVKTYDDVKAFLFQILGSDQKEFVREFTWLVFRKAAAEDKYCALFAKLLAEIQRTYPVILEEMRNLHTTYLDIWDASEDSQTKVDRRCRLGYSQFLAELTALQVLEVESMVKTLEVLKKNIAESVAKDSLRDTVEEYIDCLKRLCGAKMSREIRKVLADVLVPEFTAWIDASRESVPGFSAKSRFACMDLRDLLQKA